MPILNMLKCLNIGTTKLYFKISRKEPVLNLKLTMWHYKGENSGISSKQDVLKLSNPGSLLFLDLAYR